MQYIQMGSFRIAFKLSEYLSRFVSTWGLCGIFVRQSGMPQRTHPLPPIITTSQHRATSLRSTTPVPSPNRSSYVYYMSTLHESLVLQYRNKFNP